MICVDLNNVHAACQALKPEGAIQSEKSVSGESCSSAKGGRLPAAVMTVWKRTLLRGVDVLVVSLFLSQVLGPGRGGASGLLHPRLGNKKASSHHRKAQTPDNCGLPLPLEQPRYSKDVASRC